MRFCCCLSISLSRPQCHYDEGVHSMQLLLVKLYQICSFLLCEYTLYIFHTGCHKNCKVSNAVTWWFLKWLEQHSQPGLPLTVSDILYFGLGNFTLLGKSQWIVGEFWKVMSAPSLQLILTCLTIYKISWFLQFSQFCKIHSSLLKPHLDLSDDFKSFLLHPPQTSSFWTCLMILQNSTNFVFFVTAFKKWFVATLPVEYKV